MPSRELLLLRHAKAVDDAATDFGRELTPEGRKQAQRMGRQLLRQRLVADVVVSSPAARAWQTAVLACAEMGIPEADLVADRRVYQADVVHLLDVLAKQGKGHRRLMLVGHNPGLTELGAYLVKPVPDDWHLAKAAAAHLVLEGAWADAGVVKGRLVKRLDP